VWLAELLVELVPDDAEVRGLAALIAFNDARRATRFDDGGALVLLEDQDRSSWDPLAIARGREHLVVAHGLGDLGPFQLEAAVAAVHATADTFDATDWSVVVRLYEALALRSPSPVVELNRAVAVSYRDDATAGLALIDPLIDVLRDYSYLHAARAELLVRLERHDEAADAFDEALRCCTNEVEARHLRARRAAVAPPLT
jgi:RNA polymerase sigma-70 factor (ECF subfamily)